MQLCHNVIHLFTVFGSVYVIKVTQSISFRGLIFFASVSLNGRRTKEREGKLNVIEVRQEREAFSHSHSTPPPSPLYAGRAGYACVHFS